MMSLDLSGDRVGKSHLPLLNAPDARSGLAARMLWRMRADRPYSLKGSGKMYSALITNIINNIFHAVWSYNLVLEPRYGKRKTLMIILVTDVVFQFLIFRLVPLGLPRRAFYLIGYILTAAVYGGVFIFLLSASDPWKSIFLVSAYYCLWTFIYGSISLLTRSGAGAGNATIWWLRIGLNLSFLSFYRHFFRNRLLLIYRRMQKGYGMIACISSLTFVMMTLLMFYNERHAAKSPGHFFVMALFYLFLLLVYILLFYFMAQKDHAHQLRLMKMHEQVLTAQIAAYEKIERNARQTRHDFRHHNMIVMALAEQHDHEGILEYLKEYEQIEDEKFRRQYSRDHALDSAISAYVQIAQLNGIEMTADIQLDTPLGISSVDLVSIFSNILENAVHGCASADGTRRIELAARQKNSMLLLKCRNSCADGITFCNGIPQPKDHEGIGVESILNIAEKYHGDVRFSVESGSFICSVLLNGKSASDQHLQQRSDQRRLS